MYIHEDLKTALAGAWKKAMDAGKTKEGDVGALSFCAATSNWQPWTRNMQVRVRDPAPLASGLFRHSDTRPFAQDGANKFAAAQH